ncbi:hypothetical protein Tco_0091419 [Tanacetum coccineum]
MKIRRINLRDEDPLRSSYHGLGFMTVSVKGFGFGNDSGLGSRRVTSSRWCLEVLSARPRTYLTSALLLPTTVRNANPKTYGCFERVLVDIGQKPSWRCTVTRQSPFRGDLKKFYNVASCVLGCCGSLSDLELLLELLSSDQRVCWSLEDWEVSSLQFMQRIKN